MPIFLSLDPVAHLAVLRYEEPYSVQDWEATVDRLLRDPRFGPTVDIMVDRTQVSAPTPAFAEYIGAYLSEHAAQFRGRRVAIVVRSPEGYGMGRMQEVLNEAAVETRTFLSEREGRAWLATPRA